ncbi:MAG: M23 family metallopeptidase [Acidobacteriota bacterium]
MKARAGLIFLAGFVAGALVFYSIAWRTGALAPGHWLSRTTRDFASSAAANEPSSATARLPTIPFPTPTLPAASVETGAAVPSGAAASAVPAFPATIPLPVETPGPAAPAPIAGALAVFDLGRLLLPVQGAHIANLKDNFSERRGGGSRPHEAIDILAPRGTPVLAVAGGRVAKLFTSQQGGLTVYQFDPTGTFAYYYAHLDRYAPGLFVGKTLARGDRVGDVGSTGNAAADAPHLHFAIFRLGPEKHWWKGEPVNPYPLLLKSEER